jgi:hypothetical protein
MLIPANLLAADFFTVRTESMRLVFYADEHRFIIPHLMRSFQNALSFHSALFDYKPTEPVVVYLQDYDDYGYAGATSVPINYMILGISPYEYTYETSPTNERINWVIGHELVHIVASDKPAGADNFFRSAFFGKVSPTDDDPVSIAYTYLTNPRKYSPRWYHEGVAVFMETWMAGGIGRAQNGWDEMVFRTMVRDGAYFYDFVGLESEGTTVDFQIGANSYLYGTRFVSYLADRYGPTTIIDWFKRGEGSHASFAGQFEAVYGRDIDDVWSEWIDSEREFQKANLAAIRQYPVTPLQPITAAPVGAVSRAHYDSASHSLYLALNAPGSLASIGAIRLAGGTVDRLADLPTPSLYTVASTAFDPASGTLFYTTKNSKGWRDLRAIDVRTGDSRLLLKNCRIGDLTFCRADSSLWGVQHHDGVSRLVRIPPPYSRWQEVLPLNYGMDLYDLDIAPDGSSIAAGMMEVSGRQRLVRIWVDTLLSGGADYEVLHDFEHTAPLNFVWSPDGRYLFGSTYYTGVSNIVRYDTQRGAMEWITNTERGLFRPVPLSADSLIAFEFTTEGFIPVRCAIATTEDVSAVAFLGQEIAEKHPVVQSWILPPPSPSLINVDSLIVATGEYEGLGALSMASLYPIIHGYKTSVGGGIRMDFFDPLLLHNLDLSLVYTPNPSFDLKEQFHAMLRYRYWQWDVSATYNVSDFYDLFGPSKSSRRGYQVSVGYSDVLINDRPANLDYTLRVSGYSDLEKLPAFQNVGTAVSELLTFVGRLKFTRLLRSLGAVDAEKGIQSSLVGYAYLSEKRFNPLLSGTFDLGIPALFRHSSLWLRTAAGYAVGSSSDPFANFFFGGFGNNWVDHGPERRYRDALRFPGAEIDEIPGKTFAKAVLEWDPPPLRFRRAGFPGVYCTWARLAFFGSGLSTNLHDDGLRTITVNAGVQLDLKLVLFSNLSSVLSVGYAVAKGIALENAGIPAKERTGEFMASLKIL